MTTRFAGYRRWKAEERVVAFLAFAVVASAVGIAMVLLRNRRPTTMQSSIGEFERGLRALAPEVGHSAHAPDSTRAGEGEPDDGDESPLDREAGRSG
jgi:hypothetical protein